VATLPPIKLDPTIIKVIRDQKNELELAIERTVVTKNNDIAEKDLEHLLLYKAAKLRSLFNDFPEEIVEDKIGKPRVEEDE